MTLGQTAAARLENIATASAGGAGVTRLPWSKEHGAALDHIRDWMRDAGLEPVLDAAGTLIGKSPNPEGKPVLLLGSHQDSVPTGGKFDGIMGVVLGCLVARSLADALPGLPFALEVLAFADEEGVRFPTALIGPRALAGTLQPDALAMTDRDGVTMRAAMDRFGVDTARTLEIARNRNDLVGYVEAHIEQGPVLEDADIPVAAVSAICGISRHEVKISGETGHAGTVPMTGRRDALVAASRIIAKVSDLAGGIDQLRATVGQISVRPGAVNAIPSDVRFTVEIRAPDDMVRERFEARIRDQIVEIGRAAMCQVSATRTYVQPAAVCDPTLTDAIEAAIGNAGLETHTIASGATHDASAMADACPIAMLFVRCRGGISHRPDEFASAEDMDVAISVLSEAIRGFATPKPEVKSPQK